MSHGVVDTPAVLLTPARLSTALEAEAIATRAGENAFLPIAEEPPSFAHLWLLPPRNKGSSPDDAETAPPFFSAAWVRARLSIEDEGPGRRRHWILGVPGGDVVKIS